MAKKTKYKSSEGLDERGTSGADPILIKKYPNRRLYNTATSSYIVLDDIIDLIKSDTLFVIQDKKTGEDITRSILNQIIFEKETKPKDYHFPLEVQKQLISMYGDTYGAMVPDYLTESMKLFVSERSRMSEAMGTIVDRNTKAMMEFSQNMARQNMELFKKSWEMFGAMGGAANSTDKTGSDSGNEGSEGSDRGSELEKLQAEIDALQQRLKTLK